MRHMNAVLCTAGMLSFFGAFLLARAMSLVTTTPLYLLLMLACATIVAVQSSRHNWHIGLYALSIVGGVLVLYAIALWGFYRPDLTVINDRTYAPDRRLTTGLDYAFVSSEWLTTTALFRCDTAHGSQCTDVQIFLGVSADYAVLIGSIALGNRFIRNKLTPHVTISPGAAISA